MENIKIKLKLYGIYLLMYGGVASYSPFLPVYLKEKELSYSRIGIILASIAIVAVFFQPLWGFLTDRYFGKIKTLSILILVSSPTILILSFAKGFYTIIFVVIVFAMFQSPILSICDAFSYEIIEKNKGMEYGKIRLQGSVGYAVVALFMGSIILRFGISVIFYLYFIFSILAIFLIRSFKYDRRTSYSKIDITDMIKILKDKRFILLLFSVLLLNIAISVNASYVSLVIIATGGNVSSLGVVWFVIAISELPSFFLGNKILSKVGILNLYLISFLLFTIRFLLISFSKNYNSVILFEAMQSITFPFYLMAAFAYINKLILPKMRTSIMALFSAFAGLGSFIGNLSGGIILEHISIFYLFRIITVVAFIGFVLTLILKVADKRYNINIKV
ncbi:MAG: MFS transporter [Clostridiaceae bacterium]